MSKIKNTGLDQYGKVLSINGIGSERVNTYFYTILFYSVLFWIYYPLRSIVTRREKLAETDIDHKSHTVIIIHQLIVTTDWQAIAQTDHMSRQEAIAGGNSATAPW